MSEEPDITAMVEQMKDARQRRQQKIEALVEAFSDDTPTNE